MTKKPFHEVVAEKLIEQLKQGTAPWQQPWTPGTSGAVMPTNPVTGKRYKGINAIFLMANSHSDPRWMTYKQAETLGAQVTKGEKGTAIQYWKFSEETIKTNEKGKPVLDTVGQPIKIEVRLERPRVFFATVFNAQQIDGLPPFIQKEAPWNAIERAEHILQRSGATIRHGENNRAFYRQSTDSIHLPDKSQFPVAGHYYATALHELGHWTGHPSRLSRDLSHPFGSEGYAREELRAEIASLILGDELGIGHDANQHAAYVHSWIKILQDDPLEIFRAAADAEKIQNHVLSLEQRQVQEETVYQAMMQDEIHVSQINSPIHQTTVSKEALAFNPQTLEEGITLLNDLSANSVETPDRVWLDIPFKQKELAKEMAGTLPNGKRAIEWDQATSRWFARPGADLDKLKPWLIIDANPLSITSPKTSVKGNDSGEKIWLALPYQQREAVKQIAGTLADGSKAIEWDQAAKCWFAHPGAPLEKLKPWLAEKHMTRQSPALSPEQEFSDALKSLGCFVEGNPPIMDGKTHRIPVEGDKKSEKSGFYIGHLDGHPAGYIKNNRTGISLKWKSKGYSLSLQEKATLQAEAFEKLNARATERRLHQEQAALSVSQRLVNLNPLTTSTPYLQAKSIEPIPGIFTDKDRLKTFIPVIDVNGKLWSMQVIKEDGTKRFTKNSRKEGCFHAIGGLDALAAAPIIIIGEGFCTAASVAKALGFSTVAAFDAGNLKQVALALHAKFPEKRIVIIGDDDQHLEKTQGINHGKIKAKAAALAVDGIALFPIFAPGEKARDPKGFTDFNDLACKSVLGLEGVKRQVNSIIENSLQKEIIAVKNSQTETVHKRKEQRQSWQT